MTSNEHFIVKLRKSISIAEKLTFLSKEKLVLNEFGSEVEFIQFAEDSEEKDSKRTFKMADPSGYKSFDCQTIIFFYLNKDLDHPTYLQSCSFASIKNSVSFMDRRDLLDYINGVSADSIHIAKPADQKSLATSSSKAAVPAAADKGASELTKLFGFDLAEKRASLPASVREDVHVMKKLKASQRTINSMTSILSVQGTKNFANIEKHAFAAFMNAHKDVKKLGSVSKSTVEQKKKPLSKEEAKRAKMAETPIIIVPAAATSLLNLYNVKEFLIDQKFVSSQEIMSKGEKKLHQVIITRDPKKVSPTAGKDKFLVLDSVETIKGPDWDRVVAVFATGQEWQFKNWPWGEKPVEIFSKILGFSLRYQDEPAAGSIPIWKVKQLQISRNKRHLDNMVVGQFWKEIDQFITIRNSSPNSSLVSSLPSNAYAHRSGATAVPASGSSSSKRKF